MAKEPMKLQAKLETWGFKVLPLFNPNEYRRKLVDLDEDFNFYISEIETQAITGKRHGKNWKKEWGFGKSTFLYNVCDFINHNYLIQGITESSKAPLYRRICSIFLPTPMKLNDVVKQLFVEEKLVLPSLPEHTPIGAKDLMRIAAFHILLEANKENQNFKNLKTIHDVETIIQQDVKIRTEAFKNMGDYLDQRLPWSASINADLKTGLIGLIYPPSSAVFEDGFNKIRVRINFERLAYILKLAKIFVLLVIDQVEYATGGQLKELIKLVTDEERYGHIHLATVMRQDWKVWVKPAQIKDYQTLLQRLEDERLSPISEEGAKDLVVSLLDEFRQSEATIPDKYYPFSEKAVEYLIMKAKDPLVHNEINPRKLLELITRVLRLAYRKCDMSITKKTLQKIEYDTLIQQVLGVVAPEEETEELETLG